MATLTGSRHPKLHPEARRILEAASPVPGFRSRPIAESRAAPVILAATPEPVAGVTQRSIPGPGGWIRLRIYRPEGVGPHPVIVYLHGGGWVFGSIDVGVRPSIATITL